MSSEPEHNLAKVGVEGSNPFARSKYSSPSNRLLRLVMCPPFHLFFGEAGGKQANEKRGADDHKPKRMASPAARASVARQVDGSSGRHSRRQQRCPAKNFWGLDSCKRPRPAIVSKDRPLLSPGEASPIRGVRRERLSGWLPPCSLSLGTPAGTVRKGSLSALHPPGLTSRTISKTAAPFVPLAPCRVAF
jgi:hypothetical protein